MNLIILQNVWVSRRREMFSGMELLKALKISLIVNGYRPLIVNGYRMRSVPRRLEEPISCVKAVNHTLVYSKRNIDFDGYELVRNDRNCHGGGCCVIYSRFD